MSLSARDLATAAVIGSLVGAVGQFGAITLRVASGEFETGPGWGSAMFAGLLLAWAAAAIWRLRAGAGLLLGGALALFCVGVYVALPVTLDFVGKKALELSGPEYVARAVIALSGLAFLTAVWLHLARRPRRA